MRPRWSQNFLIDRNIANKMVENACLSENDVVLEIGPGMGILTEKIAPLVKKVIAVEIDRRMADYLEKRFKDRNNVEIIGRDFLSVDLAGLLKGEQDEDERVKVVASIPYHIATPVIMKLFTIPHSFRPADCVIMVQKELAERIIAPCGSRTYGSLSVAVQYSCEVKRIRVVSRNVFRPKPKVDSAILKLRILKHPSVKVRDERFFFDVVRACFSQRRKKLSNALSNRLGIDKSVIEEILRKADIMTTSRAESLSIGQFALLSDLLGAKTHIHKEEASPPQISNEV